MKYEHLDPPGRDNQPDINPITHLPDHLQPPDPSWGDVIVGIWDRLTNPLPGT
jgi:hypothetical protein